MADAREADFEEDDALMEWDYGAYEGRRTVEIEVERPGWRLFRHGCPGGETLDFAADLLREGTAAFAESWNEPMLRIASKRGRP